MTLYVNGYEAGSTVGNGNVIAAGTSGPPGDAFNSVTGSPVYDSTGVTPAHNSFCEKIAANSVAQQVLWTGQSITSGAFRLYVYATANPASEVWLGTFSVGGTRAIWVGHEANGTLRLFTTGGTLWTSSVAMPLNQWNRVEVFGTQDASSATVKCSYYTGDNTSAIATSGVLTSQNTGATPFDRVTLGKHNAVALTADYWIDDVAMDSAATDYIGPITTPPASTMAWAHTVKQG
jgi:hypothetical protein